VKADEAYQCGKCGLCLMACPVYKVTREETATPRAKVHLIRNYAEGLLTATDRMQDKLECCLMCGSCTAMCPGGVHHDVLFMRMRDEMGSLQGRSLEMKALGVILPKEIRRRLAARAARLGATSLARRIIGWMRIGGISVENFPTPNRIPFRDQVPAIIEPDGPARGTVAYFTGCATHHLFEKTGHAVVDVLQRMGYRVLIPAGQECCGLPLFFHGDIQRSEDSIRANIEALLQVDCDAVVVDCATCGTALGHAYPQLMKEIDLPEAPARRLAELVWDIGEFIVENFDSLEPFLNPEKPLLPVTYHSPCHLRNHGRGKAMLETLLERLPHVDYRRTPDRDACCGGGGMFFHEFQEISKRMAGAKIQNASATGARIWATGCPGCRVQLSGNLPREGMLEFCHPVEVVSYGLRPPKA
jgi:glycolate oxidase iron-sulfur subunit